MARTITFDHRNRKSVYEDAASRAGMKLGEWIRSCCDDAVSGISSKPTRESHKAGHAENCRCLSCRK